jgi:hypothetical protein
VEVLEEQGDHAVRGNAFEEGPPGTEQILARGGLAAFRGTEQRLERGFDPSPLGLVGDVAGHGLADLVPRGLDVVGLEQAAA